MGMKNFTNTTGTDHDKDSSFPGPGSGMRPEDMAISVDPIDMLINYNEEYKTAGPILYRDEVIQQTISVLIGKNKPNAMLVGPAGCGKTKIAEDIAYRLANDDPMIPDNLKGFTIYELPLSAIVSGSSLVGELEQKAEAVINFAENPSNKAILFIDEIHQLVTASSPSYQKIAQIFKPALARGKIHIIGATTTQESRDLASDPAFNRRFSKIIVDELSKSQTVEILKATRPGYLSHYNYRVSISDDTLELIVNLAEEYKTAGSHRPDNALTLFDRSLSDAIMNRKRQEVQLAKDPAQASILAALKSVTQIPVTERQVRQTAIRLATGNSKPESLNVDALRSALSSIKGQDDIIEKLIKELRRHELNLFPSTQPMTMLFIGPSGVGKTEVTKIIAKALTGCDPIILNMTEFNSPASVNRLVGSWAGYVGSDSHAELPFDTLESNPYQLILLDEFEKCDPAVQKLFMQVFDEGTLKTNRGTNIDFSRAIIIATTNAGHKTRKSSLGFVQDENDAKTSISQLSASFDIALLNRFKQRITFHAISKETYREILKNKYATAAENIRAAKPRIQIPDEIPDDVLDTMVTQTYAPEFGARPAKKAIEDFIYDQVL